MKNFKTIDIKVFQCVFLIHSVFEKILDKRWNKTCLHTSLMLEQIVYAFVTK